MGALECTNKSYNFYIRQLINDSEEEGFIIINKILNKCNSLLEEKYFTDIAVDEMLNSTLTNVYGITEIKEFITINLLDTLHKSKFVAKYNCRTEIGYNTSISKYFKIPRSSFKDLGFVFINTDIVSTFRPVKIVRCGMIMEVKHARG